MALAVGESAIDSRCQLECRRNVKTWFCDRFHVLNFQLNAFYRCDKDEFCKDIWSESFQLNAYSLHAGFASKRKRGRFPVCAKGTWTLRLDFISIYIVYAKTCIVLTHILVEIEINGDTMTISYIENIHFVF